MTTRGVFPASILLSLPGLSSGDAPLLLRHRNSGRFEARHPDLAYVRRDLSGYDVVIPDSEAALRAIAYRLPIDERPACLPTGNVVALVRQLHEAVARRHDDTRAPLRFLPLSD